MALYDDASLIFLGSAAAGQERKDSSKVYNVKPAPVVSSTNAQDLSTFTITNVSNAANSISVSGGVATFAGDGSEFTNLNKASVFEASKKYRVDLTVEITTGAVKIQDGVTNAKIGVATVSGKYAFYFTSDSSGGFSTLTIARKDDSAAFNFTVSDVSVSEVDVFPVDFDISRDANLDATRVGPTGLIEKGRENLILQSNGFDTTWSAVNVTVTGGQEGYDGSSDAWELKMTGAQDGDNEARIRQTGISVSGVCTYSVFAKAGNVNFVRLIGVVDGTTNPIAFFDLSGNGSVTSSTSSVAATSIESFGNGWFRVSFTHKGAANPITDVRINISDGDGDVYVPTGSFIYIQDSQLEAGLVATDLITTGASTATAGIKEDEPRFDYPIAGGPPSLLIEPERKNFITHSEYFGGWQFSGNTDSVFSFTQNHDISPDGTKNASRYSATVNYRSLRNTITLSTSTSYVFSFYVKNIDATRLKYRVFNTDTGSGVGGDVISATSYYSSVSTSEWTRIEVPFTTDASGTSYAVYVADGLTVTSSGDSGGNVLFWGAQVEEGPSATSYIPCHGAAATRSTDDVAAIDTSGFSFGTTCTIFFEGAIGQFNPAASSTIPITMFASHASPNNSERYLLFASSFSSGTYTLTSRHDHNGNTVGVSKSGLTEGSKVKVAAVFNGTSQKFFVNGSSGGSGFTPSDGTSTHVAASLFESLDLSAYAANKNHTVGSVVLWGSALTDQQCIDLTTL